MKWIFKIIDKLRLPTLFEILWHLITRVSKLNQDEIDAASSVLGTSVIPYHSIRVAEGGLLEIIFRLNCNRAFTTFNTINLPGSGTHSRSHLGILIHELVHVFQYNLLGSIYIFQALKAQLKEGYKYGGWQKLQEDRSDGKHFSDYNLEQQGQIAQDFYEDVISKELADNDPTRKTYEPFIDELRKGEL